MAILSHFSTAPGLRPRLKILFSHGLNFLEQLAFPQDCHLCGAASEDALLCPACRKNLPRLSTTTCPVCAHPVPVASVCGSCLAKPPWFEATFCRFRYTFPMNHLIQDLKYRHRLSLVRGLSELMLEDSDLLPQADLILPIPLSPQRLAQRGFNQSMEIAKQLSKARDIPLAVSGYGRNLHTVPQASLPWKERHANIRGVFECALDLSDKHILVIDDVMTTGASLNEFARTLKKHGAKRVSNAVLARAYRD